MTNIFLAKVKNSNERDVVYYVSLIGGFDSDHYFGGIQLHGCCFVGFEKKFMDMVENDFDNLETILTKDEFEELFRLDTKLKGIGGNVRVGDERYEQGLLIINQIRGILTDRLMSKENKELYARVVAEEKDFVANEYHLTKDEVDEVFRNYWGSYQDRAIVSYVFDTFEDMVEEERLNLGYDKTPYFDAEEFGEDLLNGGTYHKLASGKVVHYY